MLIGLRKIVGQFLLKRSRILYDLAVIAYLGWPWRKELPPSLRHVPRTVWIETTNACNLNCVMCQTKMSKRPVGYMDLGLFERIIRECKEIGVYQVALYTVGEPFMHKELSEHLRIVNQNGMRAGLSTNGQILTKKHIDSLLKFPPSSIRYSIDGATKGSYEKTRRGGNFERLIANMKALSQAMEKANRNIPVAIDVVILEENIHELPLFYNVFKEFTQSIGFGMPNNLSADGAKDYFAYFSTMATPMVPCRMLWGSTSILYDGSVSACCRDYNGELIMGNIMNHSLLDIWNGEPYNNLREKHLAKEVSDIPMCNNCYQAGAGNTGRRIRLSIYLHHKLGLPLLNRLIDWALLPSPYYRRLYHRNTL